MHKLTSVYNSNLPTRNVFHSFFPSLKIIRPEEGSI